MHTHTLTQRQMETEQKEGIVIVTEDFRGFHVQHLVNTQTTHIPTYVTYIDNYEYKQHHKNNNHNYTTLPATAAATTTNNLSNVR